jgi:hypothetical protein
MARVTLGLCSGGCGQRVDPGGRVYDCKCATCSQCRAKGTTHARGCWMRGREVQTGTNFDFEGFGLGSISPQTVRVLYETYTRTKATAILHQMISRHRAILCDGSWQGSVGAMVADCLLRFQRFTRRPEHAVSVDDSTDTPSLVNHLLASFDTAHQQLVEIGERHRQNEAHIDRSEEAIGHDCHNEAPVDRSEEAIGHVLALISPLHDAIRGNIDVLLRLGLQERNTRQSIRTLQSAVNIRTLQSAVYDSTVLDPKIRFLVDSTRTFCGKNQQDTSIDSLLSTLQSIAGSAAQIGIPGVCMKKRECDMCVHMICKEFLCL